MRTTRELVVRVLADGCPIQAIVMAFGLDERTGRAWQGRAGAPCHRVPEHLVGQARELGPVQAAEVDVKQHGTRVWRALAIQVGTRLWLGGAIRAARAGAWIARLVGPIPAGALCRPVLLAGDGVRRSGPAIQAVFRAPIPTARRGRPRLRPWEDGCLGHVITPDAGRPVVGVTRRIVPGRDQLVAPLIRQSQDPGGLNTASMERLTATCRAHLARRTRALARHTQTVEAGLVLVATVANCCADHQSRRLPGISAGHTWLPRSPAMAAGITPQRGSVTDWLDDRVPPPPGVPPTPRGRPSSETQRLIDRWCS